MREWHADWLIRVVVRVICVIRVLAVAVADPAYRPTFTSTGSTPAPVYIATVSRPLSNATRSA